MAGLEEDPGSGFDLPRDDKSRTELFVSVVNGYVESGINGQLKIMAIGEAGQGKSTLINALVGSEVAKEGAGFDAGTNEIQQYHINQNGVDIAIWDTPGFGMGNPEEDQKMAEELKHGGCKKVDLALFCVRLDSNRFPTRAQIDTITKLNQVFGREFWKYCLFVFTFANNIQQLCPVGEDLVYYFSQRCNTLEDQIRAALKKHVKLQGEELGRVRAIPVGSYKKGLFRDNPWALPDREDWFIVFWLECTEHMQSSALSALLRVNYHRLEAIDASETSICPPPQFDPYERLLQATSDEIHDVKLQIEKDETNLVKNADPEGTRQRVTGRSSSNPPATVHPPIPVTDVSSSLGGVSGNIDVEKGIYDREIPLPFETLKKQLEDENSGFSEYVSAFAKERRKTHPWIGYLRGLIDGLRAYFNSSGKRKSN